MKNNHFLTPMHKSVYTHKTLFDYEVVQSNRKTYAISIDKTGKVKVASPKRSHQPLIERFISEKENWILKHLENLSKLVASIEA